MDRGQATQLETALESVPSGARIGAVVPLLNGIDHVRIYESALDMM